MSKYLMIALAFLGILAFGSDPASAEQCVDGVRALVPWTKNAKGAADTWVTQFPKSKVNQSTTGCAANTPCVLVYPHTYGSGIDRSNGHVAVLKGCSGKSCDIQDSNGICGGNRKSCQTKPDFTRVSVIHP